MDDSKILDDVIRGEYYSHTLFVSRKWPFLFPYKEFLSNSPTIDIISHNLRFGERFASVLTKFSKDREKIPFMHAKSPAVTTRVDEPQTSSPR
jgi:hypothetical protein